MSLPRSNGRICTWSFRSISRCTIESNVRDPPLISYPLPQFPSLSLSLSRYCRIVTLRDGKTRSTREVAVPVSIRNGLLRSFHDRSPVSILFCPIILPPPKSDRHIFVLSRIRRRFRGLKLTFHASVRNRSKDSKDWRGIFECRRKIGR